MPGASNQQHVAALTAQPCDTLLVMDETDFRSPRDEVTTDDYSSSDEDSRPSTSDCSPDRRQQQSAAPIVDTESHRNSAQQRRPAVPTLGFKVPALQQQASQPSSLSLSGSQHIATGADSSPGAMTGAAMPSLQLPRSFSRGTDSSAEISAPSRSLSKLQSQRKSNRQSPRSLYTIQLASDALTLDTATLQRPQFKGLSTVDAVKQYCATELGIKQSAIKLYQVHEVSELTDSSTQLAIAIEGSGQHCTLHTAIS